MSVFYFQIDIYLGFQNELKSDVSFILLGALFLLDVQVIKSSPPFKRHHPGKGLPDGYFEKGYQQTSRLAVSDELI